MSQAVKVSKNNGKFQKGQKKTGRMQGSKKGYSKQAHCRDC